MRALLVTSFFLFLATGYAHAEECSAFPTWFNGTNIPSNAEPPRGIDCAFYQWAWETFLYVTDKSGIDYRFRSYETYGQVFHPTQPLNALGKDKQLMILSPRLVKQSDPNSINDLLQAGSNKILIDQAGHVIFYNIIINPIFADFIKKNKLNNFDVLKKDENEDLLIEDGSVEFKGAWQIVDKNNPPKDRIVIEAKVPWLKEDGKGGLIIDDTRDEMRSELVSLIGLHVVGVAKGHPEMIWATFEYDGTLLHLKGIQTS